MSPNLMQSRNFLKEEIRKFSHSSVALSRTLCIMSSHEWITTQELQSWYPWLTTWLLTKFRKQRLLHYIKAGHKTLLYNFEKFEAALERLACGWSGGSRDNFRRSAVCGSPEPRRLDADATRSMHERSKADGSGWRVQTNSLFLAVLRVATRAALLLCTVKKAIGDGRGDGATRLTEVLQLCR